MYYSFRIGRIPKVWNSALNVWFCVLGTNVDEEKIEGVGGD